MSDGLTNVSTSSLERLLNGLRDGQLRSPLTRSDLVSFGMKEQLDALVHALEGHSHGACGSILEAVLAERSKADRPAPELVWTGPDTEDATARDTAVVLRELFESARHRVLLAGYHFRDAATLLAPLHKVMRSRGVPAHVFIEVKQPETDVDPDAFAQEALGAFVDEHWGFGPPFPSLYCDRRSLTPGPPWSSLHAKCVAVDGERALVSSANFTARGQERNIETGVLLHDAIFARHLERQLMRLVESGLVVRWRGL